MLDDRLGRVSLDLIIEGYLNIVGRQGLECRQQQTGFEDTLIGHQHDVFN